MSDLPRSNSIAAQPTIMHNESTAPTPVFDGIQENTNPIPRWWKWILIGTLAFVPMYLLMCHTGAPGSSTVEQFQAAMDANTKKQYQEIGDLVSNEATMVEYLQKPQWVAVGGSIFKANCVTCHGADGGGNVGPNLCDENYKHIKQLPDIIKIVNEGAGAGAMPAWAKRLSHPNDAVLVSVYVASLRGSKPQSPKAPDGSPIATWPK
jgi:cytochrome c oxidase cbb3-type subunit III